MSYIYTFTGKKFFPLSPDPESIDPVDIAHALSLTCRYTGHVQTFYSVADHSIRVAEAVRDVGGTTTDLLYALLHDASEAYIADVARPVKHSPEMEPYRVVERRLEEAIYNRFGLTYPMPDVVSRFDSVLLNTEMRDLMVLDHPRSGDTLPKVIVPMSSSYAEETWLALFRGLYARAY